MINTKWDIHFIKLYREMHPGTHWMVQEGKQPNAFHRFMQRICFGFKWSRIDDQF